MKRKNMHTANPIGVCTMLKGLHILVPEASGWFSGMELGMQSGDIT